MTQPPQYAYPPLVRPPLSPADERTWAVLSHLAPFAGSFVGFPVLGPLVVYLVHRDRSAFVRRHAAAALSFQIWLLVLAAVGVAIAIPLALLTFGIGLLVAVPIAVFVAVSALVLQILGAVAAYHGREFRYPLTPAFVS